MNLDIFDGNASAEKSLPGGVLVGKAVGSELHVMSWNIRRRVRHLRAGTPDRWNVRAPRIRALLQAEQPTLLGVQEALPDQSRFIQESMGRSYHSVGYGRGSKRGGEGCPLFYDNSKLELLSWEQMALSERPSQPGSTSWGNIVPRIIVAANFRDRSTTNAFLAINTHFDHLSRRSRLQSARAVVKLVSANELPTVVTGDLNVGAGSPPLLELLSGHVLVDAWDAAEKLVSKPWGTFASYRAPRLNRARIDWILTSPDFRVRSAAINGWQYGGGWGSDHLPVQARLQLLQSGARP